MNDPHVEALTYLLEYGPNVDYKNAPPLREETDDFRMEVDADQATFHMKVHCATLGEAKKVVEDYLRDWHVLIDLEHGFDALRLTYLECQIVDRNPQPEPVDTGVLNIRACDAIVISSVASPVLQISHNSYPSRPVGFKVSPDVETMYNRYRAYRNNQEKITSMAYMCYTVLEASAGDTLGKAAHQYQVSESVLRVLKALSNKGGPD